MNLSDINKIAEEEINLLNKAKKLDEQSEYLASTRNAMKSLSAFIHDMDIPGHGYPKYYDVANSEVLRIVDSIAQDVFRTAEMKFVAQSRSLRIEAKLKNQQIKNFFTESEVQ